MKDTNKPAVKSAKLELSTEVEKDLIPHGQVPEVYLKLIRDQIFKPKRLTDGTLQDRPTEDLMMFLYVCKRTGLDPLVKQIHAVYRWDSRQGKDVMSIQTSIDGFRLVAQRTGQYAGQDDVVYDSEESDFPKKATVSVYKIIKGARVAFVATARWNEYAQYFADTKGVKSLSPMWRKMPYLMLGKCAEALALRKAFPNELSGLYTDEEMSQSTNDLSGLPVPESMSTEKAEVRPVVTSAGPIEANTQTVENVLKENLEEKKPEVGETKQPEVTTKPDFKFTMTKNKEAAEAAKVEDEKAK